MTFSQPKKNKCVAENRITAEMLKIGDKKLKNTENAIY